MTDHLNRQLAFLQELVAEHATIAGDVMEVAASTWAIHGSSPVDGGVLLAEYDTQDEAQADARQARSPENGKAVQ